MRLYIAEKPSMGRELAQVLGGVIRKDGYLETKGGVVTWLFGHILRMAEPDEYDERYSSWRFEDLPILPEKWKMMVSETATKQFEIVKNLIEKADEIVHAGDPDREGQLLVDEVLDFLNCKKPVKRILLNALDEESIKDAVANLHENKEFLPLKMSALARSEADWLVGMNLSRAYTLAARRAGYETTLPIGRVKTPTLALVVRREREIEGFKPQNYYVVKLRFIKGKYSFLMKWIPKDDMPDVDAEGRLLNKETAYEYAKNFDEEEPKTGFVTAFEKKKKKENPPLPFSLSALQVLAGKRYGYSPQQVLDTAQKLYEKKLTTYPRSDAEYLPENQFKDGGRILNNLKDFVDEFAEWTKNADLKLKSRAWNDKKVSAHHAIIPTKVKADIKNLTEEERNIYYLVARQYIAQFYKEYQYYQTNLEVNYHEEKFAASGRTEIDPGWKVLYKVTKKEADEEDAIIPLMKKGDNVNYNDKTVEEKTTKPPKRFTSSTLLAAMKGIHAYVKDQNLKKQLKAVYGIGTEATRANIIDELIKRKFLEEKKKELIPTKEAYLMIDILPDDMTYPDKTAVWEEYLGQMVKKKGTLESFLKEQTDFIKSLVNVSQDVKIEPVGDFPCPCGKGVLTRRKGTNGFFWGCSTFPACRITTDDIDGKPDMEKLKNRGERREIIAYDSKYDVPDDVFQFLNSGG